MNGSWHKDSRYWKVGGPIVCACLVIGSAVIVWRPTYTAEALQFMGMVVAIFLAGAGAKSTVDQMNKRVREDAP